MSFKPMRITVLKKLDRNNLFGGEPPIESMEEPICQVFDEGQVFEVGADGKMPEGFCTWAWRDKGKAVACCTDGLRPVLFLLERVET